MTLTLDSMSTECKATKDLTKEWITYFDLAPADLPTMDAAIKETEEYYANLPSIIENFTKYYNKVLAETNNRPSSFTPNENFDLIRTKYKGTPIEFLKAKKETKRTLFLVYGGGFLLRLTDGGSEMMQHYGDEIGNINVITSNYRVAPDATYHETYEDITNCYEWLQNQGYSPEDTVFIGNSSGGSTALSVLMQYRDKKIPLPKGLIIQSAFINFQMNTESYQKNRDCDIIAGHNGFYEEILLKHVRGQGMDDPYFTPYYGDYSNLPPILVQVTKNEIDFDDNVWIAEQCNKAGTTSYLEVYNGFFHNFANMLFDFETSKFFRNQVKLFVDQLI